MAKKIKKVEVWVEICRLTKYIRQCEINNQEHEVYFLGIYPEKT